MSKKRKRPHKKIRKTDGQSRKNKFVIIALCFLFITAFIFYYSSRDKKTNFISNDLPPYEVIFQKEGELVFIDTESQEILKEIDIEIADTAYERKQGLMFRKSMQEDQGMLFIYEKEDLRGMWMKNTYVSLDILFINGKYEIIRIYKIRYHFPPALCFHMKMQCMWLRWLPVFVIHIRLKLVTE